MTDTVESIMALANAYKIARLPGLNAKAELRAAVERIVRSLSAWEQVWEGIRDNHEPDLNPVNKPLAVAAIFQLAINRAERAETERDTLKREGENYDCNVAILTRQRDRAEAECEQLRKLLRETRQCVHEEANDEREMEGRGYYCDLAERVDAAIAQEAKP